MRFLLGLTLVLPLCCDALQAQDAPPQDVREIVLRSLQRDDANGKIARQYTFVERNEQRQIGGDGKVRKRESKTWDVTILEGTPYRRLIARNDQPLAADEEKKEAENLQRSIEQRRNETPAQRERRLADSDAKRTKQLNEMRQIPDAFDLKIVGDDTVAGAPAWVIAAYPRKGYRPRGGITRFFPKVKGKVWITKTDYQWVRAEAEAIETISFGLFIARIHKGTRASFEQTRVNSEVWLPRQVAVQFAGRIALFKMMRGEVDISFRDYRKFQAESRITDITEVPKEP
ncbi:MAG TPA: hypothetical protein VN428_08545 [Bryobacteraceae bacterium]|nr:hypothetical protein [Bryobacteraceae bacterium]